MTAKERRIGGWLIAACFLAAVLTPDLGTADSWTARKLVGTYTNWDYWWLNARLAIDSYDTLYCAVSRYNYSSPDYEHDLYVLDDDGNVVSITSPWSGFDYQPIVQDVDGSNIYINQPVLGQGSSSYPHMDAGVTDDSNCVSTTHSRNDIIYFTRLGPNGEHLTWLSNIYAGDPWSGRSCLAMDPLERLHCTFADNTDYLVYGTSEDHGDTWSWDTLATYSTVSHVRVAATPDTSVHIVFRTWTSGDQLRYMKLDKNGEVMVDVSTFSEGSSRWAPNVAVDHDGNIRVVYGDGAQTGQNLYYTVLDGSLDMGGQPASDSALTIVPDTLIQTDPVRLAGPKICIDSQNRAHVVFEQGEYGTGTTKRIYHIRQDIEFGVNDQAVAVRPVTVTVAPNPVRSTALVRLSSGSPGRMRVELYDLAGRKVMSLREAAISSGEHVVQLDASDLTPGIYMLRCSLAGESFLRKVVITGRS
ncbi:T9SS type A sorting domain-containing protein [Candidatus Fermentibacteria bacterium]|nr:T9SS type A sorting domain-containing protein [Candidatus Fermentibacteria bacterium]